MIEQKTTQRVLAKDTRGRAETRRFAFAPVQITATTDATAQLIVSAGEGEVVDILALNISCGAVTDVVSLCTVDAGDSPSAANTAIKAASVAANTVLDLGGKIMLNRGQSLYAFSGTTGNLRVSGWVTAHL